MLRRASSPTPRGWAPSADEPDADAVRGAGARGARRRRAPARAAVAPPTTWRVRTLVLTDRADEAARRDRATARARRPRSARCGCARPRPGTRPSWRCAAGRIAEAENEARMVFDLVDDDVNVRHRRRGQGPRHPRSPSAAPSTRRVSCSTSRGLAGALGPRAVGDQRAPRARAELWLAEGDYERALAEALRGRRAARGAGPAEPDAGRPGARPPPARWRTSVAATRRSCWPTRSSRSAERFGAPVPIAGALHARAVAEADDAGARRAVRARARPSLRRPPARARVRPCAAGARQHAGLHGPPRRGARCAAPSAGRRRRRGRGAAGRARPARARGDRSAPAPGGDRGPGRADPAPAPDLRAGRGRQEQPRDRPGAVPERQDGRDPSAVELSQARRQRTHRVGSGAGRA